jgi:hypothetical protein
MKITNTAVYDLEKAVISAGYSFMTDYEKFLDNRLIEEAWPLAISLGNDPCGSGHDSFLKLIAVHADFTAPAYWWPQFQRYHFADIGSSQSKMHCLTKFDLSQMSTRYTWPMTIEHSKIAVELYNEGKISMDELLSNVHQGLELTARVSTNYLQIKSMCFQRKDHALEMWHKVFLEWAKSLPDFSDMCLKNLLNKGVRK